MLAQWSSLLSNYCIEYEPWRIEKGHSIASLLADFLVDEVIVQECRGYKEHLFATSDKVIEWWTVYFDGSHGKLGSGIRCLVIKPSGEKLEK